MFFTLFFKECKQMLRSLVYYIYVIVFVLFLTSQMGNELVEEIMKKPEQGQEFYGTSISDNQDDIMGQTLASLMRETAANTYATYPMGFYKRVTLNERQVEQVRAILLDCAGKSWKELEQAWEACFSGVDNNNTDAVMQAQNSFVIRPREDLTYEQFCSRMEQVSGIIGRGSSYEKKSFAHGVSIPLTYEQASAEYTSLLEQDRVTRAVSRLFCDYAGIVLAVLPMFLAVTRSLRDKRADAVQVIYARKASSAVILISRYAATAGMAFLPVVLTAFVTQLPFQYHAKTLGASPDVLAFLNYSLGWLLPELLAVIAIAFLITEFTGTLISIFIQVFWAVASLFKATGLVGNFGLRLVIRWNEMGMAQLFEQQKMELWINRGFYVALAALALGLAVVVYEKKRREGDTWYGKVRKRRKHFS